VCFVLYIVCVARCAVCVVWVSLHNRQERPVCTNHYPPPPPFSLRPPPSILRSQKVQEKEFEEQGQKRRSKYPRETQADEEDAGRVQVRSSASQRRVAQWRVACGCAQCRRCGQCLGAILWGTILWGTVLRCGGWCVWCVGFGVVGGWVWGVSENMRKERGTGAKREVT
jgi:hypothetical protein